MSYWFSWKNKKGDKVIGTSSGLDSGKENSWLNAIVVSIMYSSILGIFAVFIIPRVGMDRLLSPGLSFLMFFVFPFVFFVWKLSPNREEESGKDENHT